MKQVLARVALLALSVTPVLTAPAPASSPYANGFISNTTGTTAPVPSSSAVPAHVTGGNEYIVLFNASHPEPPEVEAVLNQLGLASNHSDVTYTFNNTAFRGFVAKMESHCIDFLNNMTEISHVEQTVEIQTHVQTATGSPWGLQRISSSSSVSGNAEALDFTYSYDDANLGKGVNIYVVDTGINVEHVAFGGRASVGWSYNSSDSTDGDGHGTHCAGTAAGNYFGIAREANLIAVKVLGPTGSGATSDTIAGMDFVITSHTANVQANDPKFVGSVMTMSWGGGGTSAAIDTAIKQAVAAGIHVSVAAGNSGKDSCSFSPSSSGGDNGPAVTVGAIDMSDQIASFSNTGACNDVYAPGDTVISAWKDSPVTINILSGTSMACPHVAGVMAYLMAQNSTLANDPAAMKAYLRSSALGKAITGSTNSGDPMRLVNNGVQKVDKRWVVTDRSASSQDVEIVSESKHGALSLRGLASSVSNLLKDRQSRIKFVLKGGDVEMRY